MSDLGNILRQAREKRGLSLEDLQDMTKIRKRYLEAIEEGNYKVLPGNFYVRAFVKNYAESVGLDADEVLQLYHKEMPAAAHERTVEQPILKPRRTSNHTSDRVSKWGFRLLMWSFIAVIAVVVYVFAIKNTTDQNGQGTENAPIAEEDQPPQLNTENGNAAGENTGESAENAGNTGNNSGTDNTGVNTPVEQEPEAPAVTLTFAEKKGSTDYYTVTPLAGLHKYEIVVAGNADCWYEFRSGNNRGEVVNTSTLSPGGSVIQELEGPVYIKVGNASVVDIKVDGNPINDDDTAGPRRFQIEPADAPTGTAVQ